MKSRPCQLTLMQPSCGCRFQQPLQQPLGGQYSPMPPQQGMFVQRSFPGEVRPCLRLLCGSTIHCCCRDYACAATVLKRSQCNSSSSGALEV